MPPTRIPVDLLADLRRVRASGHDDQLREALDRWALHPLTGGRNNHVYAWHDPNHGPTCIKIYYRADDRRRTDREWSALTLLAQHNVDGVPRPLWIDDQTAEPAVGMTLLAGTPLLEGGRLLDGLKGMAHTVQRLQEIPLTGLLAGLDRIDSIGHYAFRLTDLWPGQLAEHPGDPLTAEMHRLLDAWHASGDHNLVAERAPLVFSRGDANLLNWLTDGDAVRCVDFEFSGRSTVANDAADQIEHISARDVPDPTWYDLLTELGVDGDNRAQFEAAQRTCALRWLAVLWKQRDRRTGEFARQLDRVRLLQGASSPWRL